MEYIEFFFGNFWHWLGLVIIIEAIFSGGFIRFIRINAKEENKVEKEDKE